MMVDNKEMYAAVYEGIENMQLKKIPVPKCPKGGLLVKVIFCGICGGDIRNFSNGLKNGITNQIMGHEIGGIIVEADSEVTEYKVGQRVALAPDISCGKCWYCKKGLVNLCENHRMLGTHLPGGYAQYIALPSDVLEHGFIETIPDDMPYEHAAFAEAASGVVACHKRFKPGSEDTVVIIGDGPIGCLHIEMTKAAGAKAVIAGRSKLSLAKQFNPDLAVDNRDPEKAIKQVLDYTDGRGADTVILALGPTGPQMEALRMVRKRGRIIIYGGAPKSDCMMNMDSNLVHYNEVSVEGSFSYSSTGLADALDAIYSKKIHADKYLKHVVPLDKITEGMDLVKKGEALKVLIDPWLPLGT